MEASTVIADLTANTFNCLLFDFLTNGVIVSTFSILGTVGNMLSVLTFWSKRNESATSLLLLSLAIADTGVLVTHAIMICPPAFCPYMGACDKYMKFAFRWMTAYFWPVASTCHLSSTWLIILVMLNRYIGVCHPHKFKAWMSSRQTKIHVCLILVASLVYNLPRFFDDGVRLSATGEEYLFTKSDLGRSSVYHYLYNISLYYLLIYLFPFAMLTYMTIHLIKGLELTKLKRNQMTKSKKEENDVTLTLVVVVIVYMICQILNPVRRLVFLIFPSTNPSCGNFMIFLTTLGVIVNSAVNFIIYLICSPRFRYQLLKKINCLNRVMDIHQHGSRRANTTVTK